MSRTCRNCNKRYSGYDWVRKRVVAKCGEGGDRYHHKVISPPYRDVGCPNHMPRVQVPAEATEA